MGLARARQQKAFHTGPSYGAVSRKISCFGVDHHRAADCKGGGAGCRVQGAGWMQGAGCGVRAGCVRCGQGGHRQRPGDGCAISLQEISIVRQKKDSSVGRAVRGCGGGARCEGGAVGEASVKARYLHGVSARHRSWYEWIFLGLQGGGRAGAGGGRRWAGPTFRSARRRVLHVRARGKAPCQGRTLACSGGGWVDRRAWGARPRVRCGARGARGGGVRAEERAPKSHVVLGPLILA